MDWFVRAFIVASLCWLALGVTLGVAMAVQPAWLVYYPAHAHMNLLGFVTMMIYGVAYHVIPRFVGRPIRHRWLAGAQWYASNIGLGLMATGFGLRPHSSSIAAPVLGVGGLLVALGSYAFIFNMWRTLVAPSAREVTRRGPLATVREDASS